MNPISFVESGIVVQSADTDKIVWRIHVLGINTFGKHPPNFLLCEVDCSPRITE